MKSSTLPLTLALGAEASWAVLSGLFAFELSDALGIGLLIFALLLGGAAWLTTRSPPGRRVAAWLQGPIVLLGVLLCLLEPNKPWLGLSTAGVGGVVFAWALFGPGAVQREPPRSNDTE